jgi:hypothetical protein
MSPYLPPALSQGRHRQSPAGSPLSLVNPGEQFAVFCSHRRADPDKGGHRMAGHPVVEVLEVATRANAGKLACVGAPKDQLEIPSQERMILADPNCLSVVKVQIR